MGGEEPGAAAQVIHDSSTHITVSLAMPRLEAGTSGVHSDSLTEVEKTLKHHAFVKESTLPCHPLPCDVFVRVYMFCSAESPHVSGRHIPHRTLAPWKLAPQKCRNWFHSVACFRDGRLSQAAATGAGSRNSGCHLKLKSNKHTNSNKK